MILSLSLGSAFVIFGLGLLQFIKNKSFKKVDKDIIVYGFVWILLIGLWFLFDHVLIFNYRPVLIKGGLEPSFPSTHVFCGVQKTDRTQSADHGAVPPAQHPHDLPYPGSL